MGTTTGVVVTILVNGIAIKTIILAPKPTEGATGPEEQEELPPRQVRVQVTVRDNQEKERTIFYADVFDCIYIMAWVEEDTEEGTVSLDSPVQFQLASGRSWLRLDNLPSSPPAALCCLQRSSPEPIPEEAHLDPPQVVVTTSIDGAPVSVPVGFSVRRFRVALSGDTVAPEAQALEA
ncbi:MAG: hypothetical protein ACE15E_19300 [Acidobacteriota bacterium]